jgi:hypothetical protein
LKIIKYIQYENEKMRCVDTIPGMVGEKRKKGE